MNNVIDGWIPCTEVNEPPGGLRFDVMYASGDAHPALGLAPAAWSARVSLGQSWRPAIEGDWLRNTGVAPVGAVDIIASTGDLFLADEYPDEWNWAVDLPVHVLWWRQSAEVGNSSRLLSELVTAGDELVKWHERWLDASRAVRKAMGDCDRVTMRADGELYLVSRDDGNEIYWEQVDEVDAGVRDGH